ncbi:MAG TPA: hypothetical protein PKZ41_04485 [Candidatus Omnitrophota bacterium]|nr:hypothetical protein [Candidatus Omnitrophota bacterium]
MKISRIDPQDPSGIFDRSKDLLLTNIPEIFFPNPRVARRVLAKDPPKGNIEEYFSSCMLKNPAFSAYDNDDIFLVGFLEPMKFESSVFDKNMAALKIHENRQKNVSLGTKNEFLDEILDFAEETGIEHLSCKVSCGDISTAQALENSGFLMVSNLITCLYVRGAVKIPRWKSIYKTREASPADKNRVIELTRGAFPRTRFYNDPWLDKEKCGRLYEEWAANCFDENWASNIFVAENSRGDVVGYLTYLIDRNVKNFFGAIKGGNGISACEAGSKGAYPALMAHSILDVPRYDASFCEYSTQSENSQVLRIWQKFGLEYGKSELVFHKALK